MSFDLDKEFNAILADVGVSAVIELGPSISIEEEFAEFDTFAQNLQPTFLVHSSSKATELPSFSSEIDSNSMSKEELELNDDLDDDGFGDFDVGDSGIENAAPESLSSGGAVNTGKGAIEIIEIGDGELGNEISELDDDGFGDFDVGVSGVVNVNSPNPPAESASRDAVNTGGDAIETIDIGEAGFKTGEQDDDGFGDFDVGVSGVVNVNGSNSPAESASRDAVNTGGDAIETIDIVEAGLKTCEQDDDGFGDFDVEVSGVVNVNSPNSPAESASHDAVNTGGDAIETIDIVEAGLQTCEQDDDGFGDFDVGVSGVVNVNGSNSPAESASHDAVNTGGDAIETIEIGEAGLKTCEQDDDGFGDFDVELSGVVNVNSPNPPAESASHDAVNTGGDSIETIDIVEAGLQTCEQDDDGFGDFDVELSGVVNVNGSHPPAESASRDAVNTGGDAIETIDIGEAGLKTREHDDDGFGDFDVGVSGVVNVNSPNPPAESASRDAVKTGKDESAIDTIGSSEKDLKTCEQDDDGFGDFDVGVSGVVNVNSPNPPAESASRDAVNIGKDESAIDTIESSEKDLKTCEQDDDGFGDFDATSSTLSEVSPQLVDSTQCSSFETLGVSGSVPFTSPLFLPALSPMVFKCYREFISSLASPDNLERVVQAWNAGGNGPLLETPGTAALCAESRTPLTLEKALSCGRSSVVALEKLIFSEKGPGGYTPSPTSLATDAHRTPSSQKTGSPKVVEEALRAITRTTLMVAQISLPSPEGKDTQPCFPGGLWETMRSHHEMDVSIPSPSNSSTDEAGQVRPWRKVWDESELEALRMPHPEGGRRKVVIQGTKECSMVPQATSVWSGAPLIHASATTHNPKSHTKTKELDDALSTEISAIIEAFPVLSWAERC